MDKEQMRWVTERYGIGERTVRNWQKAGEVFGKAPPWGDGERLLDWYRDCLGREPQTRLVQKVAEMQAAQLDLDAGQSGADDAAADAGGEAEAAEVQPEAGEVSEAAVIEAALARLGLNDTLSNLVAEEAATYKAFKRAQEAGETALATRLRADWLAITQEKRQMQKSQDAVAVALELCQNWVKAQWRAELHGLKVLLGGGSMGMDLRVDLLAAEDEAAWVQCWDMGLDAVLEGWFAQVDEVEIEQVGSVGA